MISVQIFLRIVADTMKKSIFCELWWIENACFLSQATPRAFQKRCLHLFHHLRKPNNNPRPKWHFGMWFIVLIKWQNIQNIELLMILEGKNCQKSSRHMKCLMVRKWAVLFFPSFTNWSFVVYCAYISGRFYTGMHFEN